MAPSAGADLALVDCEQVDDPLHGGAREGKDGGVHDSIGHSRVLGGEQVFGQTHSSFGALRRTHTPTSPAVAITALLEKTQCTLSTTAV